MVKKWASERKWEASNTEKRFEQLLAEHGYVVVGIKEYISKTEYLIFRDGIEHTASIRAVDTSSKRGDTYFEMFEYSFDLKKKIAKLEEMK